MNVSVGVSASLILYVDDDTIAHVGGDRPLRASVGVSDGHMAITFRHVEDGPRLRPNAQGGHTASFQLKDVAGWGRRCPRFRKTAAATVTKGEDGMLTVVILQDSLLPPMRRLKSGNGHPTPVSEPVPPDLGSLVRGVNDVKRKMGAELVLTIAEDGTLRARVEYA